MPKYIIKIEAEIEIEAPSVIQANTIWKHTIKNKEIRIMGCGYCSLLVDKRNGTRHCGSIDFKNFRYGKLTKAPNVEANRASAQGVNHGK
jgi:hypothetical protein